MANGTRVNPGASQIAGTGKGQNFAVPNPGLSAAGTLGDAIEATTVGPIDVSEYHFVTLHMSTSSGGTVAPQGNVGADPASTTNGLTEMVPLSNVVAEAGAVTVADLVYTYAADTTITIPVAGIRSVQFVLTGGPSDIRFTKHS